MRWSARLATYRSYRDALSRDAMRAMGVDTDDERVVSDLVFALPAGSGSRPGGTVGVGVMDCHGANDERERAAEIHASYLARSAASSAGWSTRAGRSGCSPVTRWTRSRRGHRADVAAAGLATDRLLVEPATTLDELIEQMADVDTVVATRYHNIVCALRLASRPCRSATRRRATP